MNRTTPEEEWRRLQWNEFQDAVYPTRAVGRHRTSRRPSAHELDFEFEAVWMTPEGDVSTWEPARFLSRAGNVDFREYVRAARLVSHVRAQVARERAAHPDEDDVLVDVPA